MKQKDILFVLISATIVVFILIFFEIYRSFINSTISENLMIKVSPINPNFDSKTVEDIKNRIKVEPLFNKIPEEKQEELSLTNNQEKSTNEATIINQNFTTNKASQEGELEL